MNACSDSHLRHRTENLVAALKRSRSDNFESNDEKMRSSEKVLVEATR